MLIEAINKNYEKLNESDIRNDFLNTCQQVESSANLLKIAKEIRKSQNVVVYGTGQAQSHCAMEMQRLFVQMNKYIYYVGASDELYMLSKNLGPDDLVIVISLSGNVHKIKDTLQLLHLKKVKLVSITNLQSNLLAGMSDYSLYAVSNPVKIGEHLYHNSFANFLTVIEYVFLSYIKVSEGQSPSIYLFSTVFRNISYPDLSMKTDSPLPLGTSVISLELSQYKQEI